MSSHPTYLITGANRGLGLGLTQTILQRPSTTVIACVRNIPDPSIQRDLAPSPHHATSKLIIEQLDSSDDPAAVARLMQSLHSAHSIDVLDVVIANAGAAAGLLPVMTTSLETLRADFEVNVLGSLKLFRASYNLLNRSAAPAGPKFVLVSSALGSIGGLDEMAGPSFAYGMSKAAANFMVRKIHFEHANVVAFAIHPGWVKTEMGQGFADAVSVATPPMEVDDSVNGMLKQIDSSTKDTTSGTFISYDGTAIPR